MSTDNVSVTSVTLSKRSEPQKHRIHSHSQSTRKPRIDEFRINRTMTATNRPSSKLPHVPARASMHSSTIEPMAFKRYRTQEKDPFATAPPKLERALTTLNADTRLPVLYSLTSDHDQKRMFEFRRRQIYALNHFMRDLEQEQFRQFCRASDINTDKPEEINKDLLT